MTSCFSTLCTQTYTLNLVGLEFTPCACLDFQLANGSYILWLLLLDNCLFSLCVCMQCVGTMSLENQINTGPKWIWHLRPSFRLKIFISCVPSVKEFTMFKHTRHSWIVVYFVFTGLTFGAQKLNIPRQCSRHWVQPPTPLVERKLSCRCNHRW